MNEILQLLLAEAAAIVRCDNEVIFDIDVHEQMFEAVLNPYINPKENYRVPDCFGMFSDQVNLEIKTAILKFTRRDSEYAAMHQPTIRDRMDDF